MITVEKTKLEGVLLIKNDIFRDSRGEYVEIYNEKLYHDKGIFLKFVQDDISVSAKNVLRGLHGDHKTWKLVTCLHGRIFYVVACCDEKKPDFGQWEAFELSGENRHQVLVPPGHGVGLVSLSETIVFHYKQTTYYEPRGQFTYTWNDPRFKIAWPVANPILSKRDEMGGYPDEK